MGAYYVYIVTNHSGTLYIGVTNGACIRHPGTPRDLERRMYEHKSGQVPGFSSRYKTDRLVYFEEGSDIQAAISREKQLKGWTRKRKIALIAGMNPRWQDLSEDWFVTSEAGTAGLDSSLRSE